MISSIPKKYVILSQKNTQFVTISEQRYYFLPARSPVARYGRQHQKANESPNRPIFVRRATVRSTFMPEK